MSSIKLKELLLNKSFSAISLLLKKYLLQVSLLLMTQGFLIDDPSECHKQRWLHFLNAEIISHQCTNYLCTNDSLDYTMMTLTLVQRYHFYLIIFRNSFHLLLDCSFSPDTQSCCTNIHLLRTMRTFLFQTAPSYQGYTAENQNVLFIEEAPRQSKHVFLVYKLL